MRPGAGHAESAILLLALLSGVVLADRGGGASAHSRAQTTTSLLRTVPVGTVPVAVAVDEQTQRAFVVNSGPSRHVSPSRWPDGSVSVLDTATDSLLATVAVPFNPHALALDRRTARVFVLSNGAPSAPGQAPPRAAMSILNARTGRVMHREPLGPWPGAVAVDERANRVLVVDAGAPDVQACRVEHSVTLLDARDGRVLRRVHVGGNRGYALAVDEPTGHAFLFSCSDVPGTGGSAPHWSVTMLSTGDGRILRRTAIPGMPQSLAVAARSGRVFVTSSGPDGVQTYRRGHVTVLDARTGRALQTVADPRGPVGVAVDERTGHVFVTDGAGLVGHTVTMLDLHLRRVLRIIPVGPGPIAVAVDQRDARAFVCTGGYPGGNSVSVLDTAHGHRERTVPVGTNPTALAVDETTGHVFVVNEGSGARSSAPEGSVSILTLTR